MTPRWTDEDGLAGLEALVFGVLIFVIGTLIIVNAWGVIDGKLAASSAAREAARAVAEAPPGTGMSALATAVAEETVVGHGKDAASMTSATVSGSIARCARVSVEVVYRVPTISLPWVGTFGGGIVDVHGRHTEVVDPFRSGLEGEANCAY